MRRWNGWGELSRTYPLSDSAIHYLAEELGTVQPPSDISLQETLTVVPPSHLPTHPLITTDPEERLRHARGLSLPDWIALRYGKIDKFPDGVAYPHTEDQVKDLLQFADEIEANLIPYGGGTSVVGHITPPPTDVPNLTVDLSRLRNLHALDETSQLATFGAGIRGVELEKQLNQRGFTLGHFPQSFEFSTLGGWIATRSSGQQSYYYGRIKDLFVGGHLETPAGPFDLPIFPASAAGPDLRHLILGSEGRYGILTRATVRIRTMPEAEGFYAVMFHDWETGLAAVRKIAQSGLTLSMLRLSDADETRTTFMLSGKDRLVKWAERGLRLLDYGSDRCMLIFGVTGGRRKAGIVRDQVIDLVRDHKGLMTGILIGEQWRKTRFLTPYLRNTLWDLGYALDTLETAVAWDKVLATAATIKIAIQEAIHAKEERVLVFAHLSHVYRDGASIYVTYIYPRSEDPQETLQRWRLMKSAASQVIVDLGGTISHQHGIGRDHKPYLKCEKGEIGIQTLANISHSFDPKGLLNPGALFDRDL